MVLFAKVLGSLPVINTLPPQYNAGELNLFAACLSRPGTILSIRHVRLSLECSRCTFFTALIFKDKAEHAQRPTVDLSCKNKNNVMHFVITLLLNYSLNKESVHPMTNCHGTCECVPLGDNVRGDDITRVSIQHGSD